MHRRSAADPAFGVFVRRQIRDVFLIWIRILRFAHFSWVPGFVLPGCTAELNRRALAIGLITCSSVVACSRRRLWRLFLASGHAHQLAVCLSFLRSYYLS